MIKTSLALAFFFTILQLQGQQDSFGGTFDAALLLGGNFSQLDGDGLAGFNKIGLRGGVRITYPLAEHKSVGINILYDEKGSSSGIFSRGSLTRHLTLRYISFPLFYSFGSWREEEWRKDKIRALLSIVPARLIGVSSSLPDFQSDLDLYKDWDLSIALGIAYGLSPRLFAEMRIERSLLTIYTPPGQDFSALQNYLVTFQFSYQMNQR